jgi:protein involved in polysaccharide export with SLBB domain
MHRFSFLFFLGLFLFLFLFVSLSDAGSASADLSGPGTAAGGSTAPSAATTNSFGGALKMEVLDDTHRVVSGDRLSFRIVEDEEQPAMLVVTDSGQVEIPYIGLYPVVNKTCKQLAYELKGDLEKEFYYQATVIIAVDLLSRSRGKVYLVGSVQMPGPQDIPSDEIFTLSKAVMRAGGFREFADRKRVRITRKSDLGVSTPKTITVNLADVIERGKTEKDVELTPGDVIFVPTRLVNF